MATVPGLEWLQGGSPGMSLGQLIMGGPGGSGGGAMPDFRAILQQYIQQQFGMPAPSQVSPWVPPPRPVIQPAAPKPPPPINPFLAVQRMHAASQPGAVRTGGDAAGRGPAGGFGRPERDFRDWSGL